MPLYHSLKLAEVLTLIDVISKGRLYVGVEKEYDRLEFEAYNIDFNERDEKYLESFKLLKEELENETITYQGKFYQVNDVSTFPRPVQSESPPYFVMISRSDELAAKQGHSLILEQFPDWDDCKHKTELYRKTALKQGILRNMWGKP